ncbi:MAG TPA: hypothetical protein VN418_02085 [Gammaproteobacteria bacterium]|nr:hypothetical protein [Gammaproteobacteria bacterium]
MFAAVAAFRSASSARLAAEQVTRAEHRSLLRELSSSVQNVLLEVSRAESVANQLKIECDTLAAFTGGFGGSAHSEVQETVKTKSALAVPLKRSAEETGRDYLKLREASIEDLSQALAKIDGNLSAARTLRDELNAKLAETVAQNQLHRAKRIG